MAAEYDRLVGKRVDDYDVEKGGSVLTPQHIQALTVYDSCLTVKLEFIRKVYGILSCQLLATFAFVLFTVSVPSVKEFVQTRTELFWVAVILSFVFVIALICVDAARYNYPTNIIVLSCFTFVEAYMVAAFSSFYETTSIVQAIFITLGVSVGLTLYTFQSKHDFSEWGGGLFVLLSVLCLGGFVRLFFPFSPVLDTIWAMFGALLFCGYIVYDTFVLIHKLNPDEYIVAALSLYLDIINLFVYILELIGRADRG